MSVPTFKLLRQPANGGRTKHEVTYSDIFKNLGSRLETLTIGSWNLDEEFVRLNNGSLAFAFHHLGDRMVEVSAVIAGLDDAITSEYLPALKSVSVEGTRLGKQSLESLKRLSAEYSFELVVVT
ncbi:hypothetical protein BT69DRAFT_1301972 [Atractiella rhizophila]|nr:hypothetical protein BT69DRAFT_1301972 [Atractiella rhizophila]